jgi:hypothetical protein
MPKPKLISTSSLLDNEAFWRLLLVRLSGGTDPLHDTAVLIDLYTELGIHPKAVLAKIQTFVHGTPRGLN